MNRILAQIYAHKTSHALRRGGAEAANEHPEIVTQWLINRGDWSADSINRLFTYIALISCLMS